MPRRSVTRFFIPLIDVMTLLFCIFLLMPMVKGTGDAATDTGNATTPLSARERQELAELRGRMKEAGRNQVLSEKEKFHEFLQRLDIRVLEIDADTGKLFYYDPDRVEITSEGQAGELIQRQKREGNGRELYYLFLFPRKLTGFPEERQVKQYERWFQGVPHGFDNPRAARP
jgi:hypothetical protein